MKLPLLIILVYFQTAVLLGQKIDWSEKWFGLHELDYQNRQVFSVDTMLTNDNRQLVSTITDNKQNLALGLFYRTINKRGIFHQIDIISFDINSLEDAKETVIIGAMEEPSFFGLTQESTRIQLGYRIGKMYILYRDLSADASFGLRPTYIQQEQMPLPGTLIFPRSDTRIGISGDFRFGLNYQVHPRINIGYSIAPMAGQLFWHQQRVDNPILTEEQKTSEMLELNVDFFENLLDIRHLSVRYVFSS
ncbi:MAG: hypothetical protein AAGJ93_11920 [Bacteroidota bacterium]